MTSTLPHRLRTTSSQHLRVPRQLPQDDVARPETPYLELDVRTALDRFAELAGALPGTAVHYAVKANPDPRLLVALAAAGCRFDVASPAEVQAALTAGAAPEDL